MVIAFVNHKGGVGKTTCTLNIGAGLRRQGKSVLLIDADAQANLTTSTGLSEEETITLYDVFHRKTDVKQAIIHREGEMDIIAGCLELSALDVELAMNRIVRREEILKQALESVRSEYDFIFIDCPPTLDICTYNALAAADAVFIPVSAEHLPIKGLNRILNVIKEIQESRINPLLEVSGVIITRYNKQQTICRDIVTTLQEKFGEKVFQSFIRENVALKEFSYAEKDIFRYAPNSLAATDFMHLTDEIIKRYAVVVEEFA